MTLSMTSFRCLTDLSMRRLLSAESFKLDVLFSKISVQLPVVLNRRDLYIVFLVPIIINADDVKDNKSDIIMLVAKNIIKSVINYV